MGISGRISQERLEKALEQSWGRETSSNPSKWSSDNPAYGQCAVTALVVQDVFLGRLLRVVAISPDEKVSHYYNELPAPKGVVDLTRRQFPKGTTFTAPEYRERDYVLSNPETAARYDILIRKVAANLLRIPQTRGSS